MTGGSAGHSAICVNLLTALRGRLQESDAGLETVNKAVRYPNALITCSRFSMNEHMNPETDFD